MESVCYNFDAKSILLQNNFLESKIEEMRQGEASYQNEIQRLKQTVSYLEETSQMRENQMLREKEETVK